MDYLGNLSKVPDVLIPWYDKNRRDLPWRHDRDPYHVWISEIMLQQTRVEAVKGYYARFLSALPTIESLASADDDYLHKLWEGLGYYSRVRNLKKAACVITEKHAGVFPTTYDEIISLPGIGEYTAGAICSISYNQRIPAVDGNVLRVIARLTDDATPIDIPQYKKSVRDALEEIYPQRAGDFTQALMELGATVCGPNKRPDCSICPCNSFCLAYRNETAENLPVKSLKRKRKVEDRTVFILSCDGFYALQKRSGSGLLADLWQFPNVSGQLSIQSALAEVKRMDLKPKEILRTVERKHIFTHIEWQMRGVYMEVHNKNDAFTWLTAEQIKNDAALPTAFKQFWDELEI